MRTKNLIWLGFFAFSGTCSLQAQIYAEETAPVQTQISAPTDTAVVSEPVQTEEIQISTPTPQIYAETTDPVQTQISAPTETASVSRSSEVVCDLFGLKTSFVMIKTQPVILEWGVPEAWRPASYDYDPNRFSRWYFGGYDRLWGWTHQEIYPASHRKWISDGTIQNLFWMNDDYNPSRKNPDPVTITIPVGAKKIKIDMDFSFLITAKPPYLNAMWPTIINLKDWKDNAFVGYMAYVPLDECAFGVGSEGNRPFDHWGCGLPTVSLRGNPSQMLPPDHYAYLTPYSNFNWNSYNYMPKPIPRLEGNRVKYTQSNIVDIPPEVEGTKVYIKISPGYENFSNYDIISNKKSNVFNTLLTDGTVTITVVEDKLEGKIQAKQVYLENYKGNLQFNYEITN